MKKQNYNTNKIQKNIIKHKRNRKSKNENGQNKSKQQCMYKNNGCKFQLKKM